MKKRNQLSRLNSKNKKRDKKNKEIRAKALKLKKKKELERLKKLKRKLLINNILFQIKVLFSSNKRLIRRYVKLGLKLGNMLSYCYMGTPDGYDEIENEFDNLSNLLKSKGYRLLSDTTFIGAAGWGDLDCMEAIEEFKRNPKGINSNFKSMHRTVIRNPSKYYKDSL